MDGMSDDGALNISEKYVRDVWNSQELEITKKKVVDVLVSTRGKDIQAGMMKQEVVSL
ncbi:MAG: hypothetical protein M1481_07365 [Candidatus Thermoplasmatota archaeon]|nr:hypothetical protein [Candidatus Thermoplasmatota archaeon]MCL5963424.1 hypothetical protein [Candidatus Thermoplasmatota archaeon]